MNKFNLLFIITFLIINCSPDQHNYLIKIYERNSDGAGVPSGYVNAKGDTVVPIGKYFYCYTDTITNIGFVIEKEAGRIIAIDRNANELFEVFKFDNGPDYIRDGLFRIIKNGKIGYANENGDVVIEPQFECAFPFKNGIAKVSYNCSVKKEDEHSTWESDNWLYINTRGEIVNK